MGVRDKDDLLWKAVKEVVHKRDNNKDRLLKVLTIKEAVLLSKHAPKILLNKLDCAHAFAVSRYPSIVYNPDNIILLNRHSHSLLDNHQHPITGEFLTEEQHIAWWIRLLGKQWVRLQNQIPACRVDIDIDLLNLEKLFH